MNTTEQVRREFRAECNRVLRTFKPSMGNRYSGAQISRAKGIAQQNMLARSDATR